MRSSCNTGWMCGCVGAPIAHDSVDGSHSVDGPATNTGLAAHASVFKSTRRGCIDRRAGLYAVK
eukprot:30861-Chlamydomonas_euryale.AAC.1